MDGGKGGAHNYSSLRQNISRACESLVSLQLALCVKIHNSVSTRLSLTKSKKKKNIESTAVYKHMCQCTDLLNAMPNGQGVAASFSIQLESNLPDSLQLTLTTKPKVHIS